MNRDSAGSSWSTDPGNATFRTLQLELFFAPKGPTYSAQGANPGKANICCFRPEGAGVAGGDGVRPTTVDAVADGIAGQMDHHRAVTFQDEFMKFLKTCEMEYDERYIWD